MKGRSLLALPALVFALACEGNNQPTGPGVPTAPSPVISDGAHGVDGNPDFFFLPPLVPSPVSDPDFEAGKFNASLQPSLSVEICELQGGPGTKCGRLVKEFPAGTVRLQNPPDGFYQVLWKTRESNLDVTKYYRIKVMIEGSKVPLGIADVDPMSNKAFQNALTGEVIPLIDDATLPIPFRVENIGALCTGATLCSSVTVTSDNPNGDYQIVQVEGNNGPLAGALFPDGWLPADGPQSVIVTITSVNTGVNDVAAGTQANPCHANLPLQQFNGCFNFTTTPALAGLAAGGHQFARAVTVAVCYVLHDTGDPREPWVQLWSSGPNEPAHPLLSVSDAFILTNSTADDCGTNFVTVIGSNATRSNALTQLASAGWRTLKAGVGRVFGVKTAYAVDLGLGGPTLDFSNVGPALTAQIQRYTSTGLTLGPGATTTSTARIVGTVVHNGGTLTTGIGGLPVTFTVAPGNGTLRL
ncbi:MAG: hypothetical protein M3P26_16445, partial [Gemmatimonadota bacterium]|nr:hypothetical protein [Gemmatimonadota bacterium]